MEGHLYRRGKSRTYYLRYDAPTSPGERRYQKNKSLGTTSKAEAEKKKRKLLGEIDDGTFQEESASLTVQSFLDLWLNATRDRLAATTHVRYADIVRRHVNPSIGRLRLSRLRAEHLRGLYAEVKEKGLSGRSCLHIHRLLHTAFAFAVREERILKENPAALVKAPSLDHKELTPISLGKVQCLVEGAKGTRLELPVALAALSGLRRGELLGLRWRDVVLDENKGSLFVEQSLEQTRQYGLRFKSPKSRSSRRFVPLAPECVLFLKRHKESQDEVKSRAGLAYADNDLIFCNADGSPWPPDTLTAQFGKLAAVVGLKGFRFHDVRHAFATLNLANGTPLREVSALMGHSTANTTLSFYARIIEGQGRQAINDLARSLLAS